MPWLTPLAPQEARKPFLLPTPPSLMGFGGSDGFAPEHGPILLVQGGDVCSQSGGPLLAWLSLAKEWFSLDLMPPVPMQVPLLGLLPSGVRCPWSASHAQACWPQAELGCPGPYQPKGLCQGQSCDPPPHLPPPHPAPWAASSVSPCSASWPSVTASVEAEITLGIAPAPEQCLLCAGLSQQPGS